MLTKTVCRHCIGKHFSIMCWAHSDDARWRNGIVICPHPVRGKGYSLEYLTNKLPPNYCPYKFEHAVAAGITHAE